MKKNCAFTIVAKNYIGLGKVLRDSIVRYYADLDFYIIVADEFESKIKDEDKILIAKEFLDINQEDWTDMSFKYNLTEFCTSIKPFSILKFFNEGYDKVIYLDPDIKFYSSIGTIFNELDDKLVVLSPHILTIPSEQYEGFPELWFLNTGIYNLGFIGVKNDIIIVQFIRWWARKLKDFSFNDKYEGLFTDQIWVNFVTSFVSNEQILISRDCGRDVAPWNFEEREVRFDNNKIYIKLKNEEKLDELMFVHFSGFNYKALVDGDINGRGKGNDNEYPEFEKLIKDYGKDLSSHLSEYLSLNYSYNFYDDGSLIKKHHRRIYNSVKKEGIKTGNPFNTSDVFVQTLRKSGFKLKASTNHKTSNINLNSKSAVKIKKFKRLNQLSKILFKILGEERYFKLMSGFYYLSNPEHQNHLLK